MTAYSPKKFSLVISNPLLNINHTVLDYEKESSINVVYNTENSALRMGAQGEFMRVVSADQSAVITISLLHKSDSNSLLNDIYNIDKTTGGNGTFTLSLNDSNPLGNGNTMLGSSSSASIKKYADYGVDGTENADTTTRAWELQAGLWIWQSKAA